METMRRKDLRLKSWDYTGDAWYFVTVCCSGGSKVFGEVGDVHGRPVCNIEDLDSIEFSNCKVILTQEGSLCEEVLESCKAQEKPLYIDRYVVMPNHIHFIAVAHKGEGAAKALDKFVHYVKAAVTRRVRKFNSGIVLWQKGYYEHIIRDEADYIRIAEYIENNPAKWVDDKYYR